MRTPYYVGRFPTRMHARIDEWPSTPRAVGSSHARVEGLASYMYRYVLSTHGPPQDTARALSVTVAAWLQDETPLV